MKTNTINQETPNPSNTTPTFPTTDRFFPVFLNCDPSQIILPSFDDLVFLGQENLREIRRYTRGEERKAKAMLVQATATHNCMCNVALHDLQHAVSLSAINSGRYSEAELHSFHRDGHVVMCDWQGGAMQEYTQLVSAPREESVEMPEANVERINQLSKNHHRCHYGKFVAKWCSRPPKCENTNTFCVHQPTKITPVMSTGKMKLSEPHQAETVTVCPHYHECMEATRPYLDQPCLLANGDEATLQSCRDYLAETVQLCKRRVKLIAKYIEQLSAAIKQAESKPLFAHWRTDTNWTYFSHLGSPVVYVRFPTAIGYISQSWNSHWPEHLMMHNVAIEYTSGYHFHSISDPLLCKVNELFYLLEHRDYLEKVWVDWSLRCSMEPEKMRAEILQRFNAISTENIEFLKKMFKG